MESIVQGFVLRDWPLLETGLVGGFVVLLIVGGWILKASVRTSQHLRRERGSGSRSYK
jgi:hypothetical protein